MAAIYTLEQYNTLVSAIALGALIVEYSDKKVEYRSLAEMKQIKKEMEADLGLTTKTTADNRTSVTFDKGYLNRCR
jgi:hypothetical protein